MTDPSAVSVTLRSVRGGALLVALALLAAPSAPPRSSTPPALERLLADAAGQVEVVAGPTGDRAVFVRGRVPVTPPGSPRRLDTAPAARPGALGGATASTDVLARDLLRRYAALFGLDGPAVTLRLDSIESDGLGATHVRYEQLHDGVPVHLARVAVHLDPTRRHATAIVSGAIAGIELADTTPTLRGWHAVRAARAALPSAALAAAPRLVVHAPDRDGARAILAWRVELTDAAIPARGIYLVDAADGAIADVVPGVHDGLVRATYDARDRFTVPLIPRRTEGSQPSGIADVDALHDGAGLTWTYYAETHGRDSWDGAGAKIRQIARFGNGYANAGWVGAFAVFGGGLAGLDVIAHELTHGVIQSEAGLVYQGQPGALNESFADVFGAMVDRDDWEIGEETILGPIRDMADPGRFGQPAHTADYVTTCEDNRGVHINSGITNKAFHDVAQALGLAPTERIFYRALTIYLHPQTTLEEARAAAIQSAVDLFGDGSAEMGAVADGFAGVGLDGTFAPVPPDCSCAATVVTSDASAWRGSLDALRAASSLYRLRDEGLARSEAGAAARALFERHTGRAARLLLTDEALRREAAALLSVVVPRIERALHDPAVPLVDDELADSAVGFLRRLAAADRARDGGALAVEIERAVGRLERRRSPVMTLADALRLVTE